MSKRRARRGPQPKRKPEAPKDETQPDRQRDYEATVAFNEADRSDPNGLMVPMVTPLRDLYINGAIDVETFEALLDDELKLRAA